jgi:hypothetical protein
MRFRLVSSCLISLCISSLLSCGRQSASVERTKDQINLDQDVTNNTKPQDPIFVDFEKDWRKFINPSPEMALPVVPIRDQTKKTIWQPLAQAECVFSAAAGGNVPQVTLTWNETAAQTPGPQTRSQQQARTEPAKMRFDLALHYKGFERNYYSTALATDKLKRFTLPSNSELIANPDALLVTGPGLFPMLMDFQTEMVKAQGTTQEIPRQTLVLRDLAPGLAYTLRQATLSNNQWHEDKEFSFSTPVCPKDF